MDSDPYWTRAWASAIALATTILSRPELVRGKRVADLGAGTCDAGKIWVQISVVQVSVCVMLGAGECDAGCRSV
jgi:predicted RNA methylase